MKAQSYRDLIVWQKAMDLAVGVHPIAVSFPKHEMFALTSQINRAATSIPSNIAEGQGRRTTGEFIHFLGIAKGSLHELETQVTLALRYDYIPDAVHDRILDNTNEVGRLLNGLIDALERRQANH